MKTDEQVKVSKLIEEEFFKILGGSIPATDLQRLVEKIDVIYKGENA